MRKILISTVSIVVLILAVLTVSKELKNSNRAENNNETPLLSEVSSQPQSAAPTALYGWGNNTDSQIASSKTYGKMIASPQLMSDGNISPKSIFAGEASAGYLLNANEAYGWGSNDIHQIGESEDILLLSPLSIPLPQNTASVVSTSRHSVALTADGDVYTWGYNFTGQLGTGTNDGEKKPIKVSGLPKIAQVAAGYKFSLALTPDGKVYGWGGRCASPGDRAIVDFVSALSGGSAYYEPTILPRIRTSANEDCVNESVVGILSRSPKLFSGIENVTAITAGYGHGLFLKKDGTVWSFGCNLYGQLGNRGTSNSPSNAVPQQIEGLSTIKAVSAGFRHSLALTADGKVYTWGGKIVAGKNGPEAEKNKDLVLISGLPMIEKIVAGRDYSLAVASDGKLYGWGSNVHHEISPEAVDVIMSPVEIKLPGKVIDIAAGQSFVIATIEQ
jgi:hypothetical protein